MTKVIPPYLHDSESKKEYRYEDLPDNSSPASTWRNLALLAFLIFIVVFIYVGYLDDEIKLSYLERLWAECKDGFNRFFY